MAEFTVSLSRNSAEAVWGESAKLSFTESGAVIHLPDDKLNERLIQQAARKLDGLSLPAGKETKSLGLLALAGLQPYEPKADEEYMGEPQMEHFRLLLKAWRNQLREEVDRTVTHMKDEAANFPDPVDRAAQEEEFSLELRTRDRERKLIKKIEKTLKRIEEDDFGFCDQCGIEIGIRRLEARPTADLCIDCKTMAEIKEKQLQG